MVAIKRKGLLWHLFRAPVHLYRWHLGWLFGNRCLLLTHMGRRTGLPRQTVLVVIEYRKDGPEVVAVNGFGPASDWLLNIESVGGEEVIVGPQRFSRRASLSRQRRGGESDPRLRATKSVYRPDRSGRIELAARMAISRWRKRSPATCRTTPLNRLPATGVSSAG
jgi:deazaflavin-dependent oxidoreductase (nitroreductase family)